MQFECDIVVGGIASGWLIELLANICHNHLAVIGFCFLLSFFVCSLLWPIFFRRSEDESESAVFAGSVALRSHRSRVRSLFPCSHSISISVVTLGNKLKVYGISKRTCVRGA